jgi:hypothetical protein
MIKIPAAMRQGGRPEDPHFSKEEYLYRRIPLLIWDDPCLAFPFDVDAVKLPDISTARSKYGNPEWLRLGEERFRDWAVVGFQVHHIPPERWSAGFFHFVFRAVHVPDQQDYPHSEVRAYEQREGREEHVNMEGKLPEEADLEWRELLLRKIEVFLKPYQSATIRQHVPPSHKPVRPIPP